MVATENFMTALPFGSCLVSALRPINPMIRKLIEVHECFSLSARLPGHPEARGGCSQIQ